MSDSDALLTFEATFGAAPHAHAEAPGRVNLIGEHTDYHQGFVLPIVLPQRTTVHVRTTTRGRVRVLSPPMDPALREYDVGAETTTGYWIDYVQGVTWVLAQHGFEMPGADLLVESTVPIGAGVSSSAALQVSLLRSLRAAFAWPFDDMTVAKLAHEAETRFVGAAVGLMDQMVCSLGRQEHALFLDTRSLESEHVPIPATVDFAVIDSGITHRNIGEGYTERRKESFAAAGALGVRYLRELTSRDLSRIDHLPPVLQRRARHIVTENERVLAAVDALKSGDGPLLGTLFNASHASMRDDYETSAPDIDVLVSLAQTDANVFGARMTGGGFGGAIVIAAHRGAAAAVAARALDAYRSRVPWQGAILLPPYRAPPFDKGA
jgi:galactokinase